MCTNSVILYVLILSHCVCKSCHTVLYVCTNPVTLCVQILSHCTVCMYKSCHTLCTNVVTLYVYTNPVTLYIQTLSHYVQTLSQCMYIRILQQCVYNHCYTVHVYNISHFVHTNPVSLSNQIHTPCYPEHKLVLNLLHSMHTFQDYKYIAQFLELTSRNRRANGPVPHQGQYDGSLA